MKPPAPNDPLPQDKDRDDLGFNYANVDEMITKGDFTQLPEDIMMCSIALSLTDTMDDNFSFDD